MKKILKFINKSGSDDLPVFGGEYKGGVYCQQVADELAPFIKDFLDKKIDNYLEIGTAAGGSTFVLNHYFKFKKIVCVDDNVHGAHAYRPEILHGVNRIEIIGNSHDPEIKKKVGTLKTMFDMLFIDGDHDGAQQDVDMYGKFLNAGGYLLIHDSVFHQCVADVVSRLKRGRKYKFIKEYTSETHPSPCGLAVFQKTERSK